MSGDGLTNRGKRKRKRVLGIREGNRGEMSNW